ncbi:MAG: hypothetical protein RLZZ319_825 [Actinomycetota bacterium]|jgi:LPXTG-motif cell wall-anchored protein
MNTRALAACLVGIALPSLAVAPAFATNYTLDDPTSTLLDTATMTIPSSPKEFNVSGNDEHALNGNPDCFISDGQHVYDLQAINVTVEGDYTFRVVSTSTGQTEYYPGVWEAMYQFGATDLHPIEDSFLAIYKNGFNPHNIDNDVVGCNDDSSEIWDVVDANDGGTIAHLVGYSGVPGWYDPGTWNYPTDQVVTESGDEVSTKMPIFEAHLKPGHYTALISVYEEMPAAWWTAGSDGDGWSWATGDASVETEIWGPAGGAALQDDDWAPSGGTGSGDTKLAATGATGVAESALIGALALISGASLVAIRRRRSN